MEENQQLICKFSGCRFIGQSIGFQSSFDDRIALPENGLTWIPDALYG